MRHIEWKTVFEGRRRGADVKRAEVGPYVLEADFRAKARSVIRWAENVVEAQDSTPPPDKKPRLLWIGEVQLPPWPGLPQRVGAQLAETLCEYHDLERMGIRPDAQRSYRLVIAEAKDELVRPVGPTAFCPAGVPRRVSERFPDAKFAAVVPVAPGPQSVRDVRRVLALAPESLLVLDRLDAPR